ncbi:hypothetical protein [Paenibacillus kobensis]|uniref:hypothetical protein n=1 Tax=Paenibacillus kobensis TaxID=59841 RepID=UPI0013E37B9B|nr:hypothetical protein [Paenibacillus kobensis]
MLINIALCFLAGVFGANSIPHFVKGITKESYPCVFGNSSLPNLVAGWAGLNVTVLLVFLADVKQYPIPTWISGSLGVLLIGLFHAKIGAFGKRDIQSLDFS